jgi:hypothetical protein
MIRLLIHRDPISVVHSSQVIEMHRDKTQQQDPLIHRPSVRNTSKFYRKSQPHSKAEETANSVE